MPLFKIDFESFNCPQLRHVAFFCSKAEIPAHEDKVMDIIMFSVIVLDLELVFTGEGKLFLSEFIYHRTNLGCSSNQETFLSKAA